MTDVRHIAENLAVGASDRPPTLPTFSVVIPALNEASAISQTVGAIHAASTRIAVREYEVIVVDDGSADDTGRLAAAAGARVLHHPHNVGYGRSLKAGIQAARHDVIVICDADGTYPVSIIPELLLKLASGFDMVVGARTGNYYHGPLGKRLLRLVLKFMVEFTTGGAVNDVNSGLRAFRRSTVLPYFPHLSDSFSFTTSLTLAYMMTGRFVTYLPITYSKRVGKTKVSLVRDALRTIQFIVQSMLYYNPIKIFILISLPCILLGAPLAVLGVVNRHVALATLSGLAFGLGVVVFCVGLLAVLLKQIMDKPTGTPPPAAR